MPVQLDAFDAAGSNPLSSGSSSAAESLSPGFLTALVARVSADDPSPTGELARLFGPLFCALQLRASTVSLAGDWQGPVGSLLALTAHQPLMRVMAAHPNWCPPPLAPGQAVPRGQGRGLEVTTLLGPFLGISALPDELAQHRAPQGTLFSPHAGKADVRSSTATVHMYAGRLHGDLHTLFKAAAKADKDALLNFVAVFLAANADRAKMQADPRVVASLGACVNLAAAMLRMCAPFAEASPGSVDPKLVQQFAYLQPGYVACSRLPASGEDTRMAATASEAADWAAGVQAQLRVGAQGPWPWHFVCECFFLTSRAMHLGLVRCFCELDALLADVARVRQDLAQLEAARPALEAGPHAAVFRQRLEEAQGFVVNAQVEAHQYVATLTEPQLLADTLAFFRLQARFLVATAGGSVQAHSAQALGSPAPGALRCLPEYMAEDVADVLLGISRHAPQVLASARLEDFMQFLVLFVGAPEHAKNPYLRAKLVDVLRAWMPPPGSEEAPHGGEPRAHAYTRSLFEGHPLALARLVPHLLTLYVDIEFGGGRSVFYDKMNIRHAIGTLLEYLWTVPDHRAAWRSLAASTGGEFYLRFVNMLINDAIYQLAEAMKLLPEVRELEEMRADGRFAALPQREQQERGRAGGGLHSYLVLASVHLRMMRFTSGDPSCAKPFLLPEMVDRVAAMLNYFLTYLVGPDRGKLRLSPEAATRYGWDPKAMLTQLCGIYINLHAAGGATFAAAVARDERSYRDENFSEASHVLRSLALLPDTQCDALEAVAESARAHAAAGAQEEEVYAEPPEEFQDMLMAHLMVDPVRLPTGGGLYVVDRATIARHLLSNNTCPFTRAPLAMDQVVPDTSLKARIDAWKQERRLARGAGV